MEGSVNKFSSSSFSEICSSFSVTEINPEKPLKYILPYALMNTFYSVTKAYIYIHRAELSVVIRSSGFVCSQTSSSCGRGRRPRS